MYSNKVYALFIFFILIIFGAYEINQNYDKRNSAKLEDSEKEDTYKLITERNHMPDELGITLDNNKEEIKELKFHTYFSDGMVLQRDVPNNIWGYSANKAISARIVCQ